MSDDSDSVPPIMMRRSESCDALALIRWQCPIAITACPGSHLPSACSKALRYSAAMPASRRRAMRRLHASTRSVDELKPRCDAVARVRGAEECG